MSGRKRCLVCGEPDCHEQECRDVLTKIQEAIDGPEGPDCFTITIPKSKVIEPEDLMDKPADSQ